MRIFFSIIIILTVLATACKKKTEEETSTTTSGGGSGGSTPHLVFKFEFDSTQARLDNLGNPSVVLPGNAAQSPHFDWIAIHHVELSPDQWTPLGGGEIIYDTPQTTAGGDTATDFSQLEIVGPQEFFGNIPLSSITPGTYQYARVAFTYQNYKINMQVTTPITLNIEGTIASFVDDKTYITSYTINDSVVTVNSNKDQGYWGFESAYGVQTGQAPPGFTTVPNPISSTSPTTTASCIVTGEFSPAQLTITGNETSDIIITFSVSTNNSFEWKDNDANGFYNPTEGDTVVDMGVRGLVPIIE